MYKFAKFVLYYLPVYFLMLSILVSWNIITSSIGVTVPVQIALGVLFWWAMFLMEGWFQEFVRYIRIEYKKTKLRQLLVDTDIDKLHNVPGLTVKPVNAKVTWAYAKS